LVVQPLRNHKLAAYVNRLLITPPQGAITPCPPCCILNISIQTEFNNSLFWTNFQVPNCQSRQSLFACAWLKAGSLKLPVKKLAAFLGGVR
jgi:hypothetical protein